MHAREIDPRGEWELNESDACSLYDFKNEQLYCNVPAKSDYCLCRQL